MCPCFLNNVAFNLQDADSGEPEDDLEDGLENGLKKDLDDNDSVEDQPDEKYLGTFRSMLWPSLIRKLQNKQRKKPKPWKSIRIMK